MLDSQVIEWRLARRKEDSVDGRCRCPHPDHESLCDNLATETTSAGVRVCRECMGDHVPANRRPG